MARECRNAGFLSALAAASALAPGCSRAPDEGLRWLGPARIERLNGGSKVTIEQVAPAPGDFLVVVEQRDIDVALTVALPGTPARTANLPTARFGAERLLFSVGGDRRFSVEITSAEHTDHLGSVAVRIAALPAGTSTERKRRIAELAMSMAGELMQDNRHEAWIAAEAQLQSAQNTYRALRLRREAADAAYARAMLVLWPLGDNARAARLLERAAQLQNEIGEEAWSAHTLARAGSAQVELAAQLRDSADANEVLETFELARTTLENARTRQGILGRRYDRAWTVNTIGISHHYQGDFDEAHRRFAESLPEFESLGDVRGVIMVRQNQAMTDYEQGKFGAAGRRFRELLAFADQKSDAEQLMDVLTNAAIVHSVTGDLDESLRTYGQALTLQRAAGDRRGIARTYNGMAGVYLRVGALDRATTLYDEALVLRRALKDARGLTATLNARGDALRQLGQLDAALASHHEALGLADAASPNERARALFGVALDYAALGRRTELEATLRAVLATSLPPQHPLRLRALEEQAVRLVSAGDPAAALSDLESLAASFAQAGSAADVARVNFRAAQIAREAGRYEQALRLVETAVDTVESVRGRISTPEIRAQYVADVRGPFDLRVELLLSQLEGSKAGSGAVQARPAEILEALLASDQARARFLIESTETATTQGAGSLGERQERHELYDRLAGLRYHQERLLDKHARSRAEDAKLASIPLQLEQVRARLDSLEGRATGARPTSARATEVDRAAFARWQKELAADTRVVEYFLGERTSAGWVVARDAIEYHPLPARKLLEQQARLLHLRISRPPIGKGDNSWRNPAGRLYELLLAPMAANLAGKHVVVVPHGALSSVPFEVLVAAPRTGQQGDAAEPAHFSYVASIRAAISMGQRSRRARARSLLAVIADPILSRADERLAGLATDHSGATLSANPAEPPLAAEMQRLPATALEASRIAAVAGGDVLMLEGFAANRTRVLGEDIDDFRILHFATHAVADTRDPMLSAIALSAYDSQSRQSNGMLRAHQIRDLQLRADLVVLSGCESGLGRFYEGEGFVGLTHSFIVAGAGQVVATLWHIPDEATANLMTEFYRGLLSEGRDPAQALRAARAHTAVQPAWRHPFYWGAFVLIGDEKTTTTTLGRTSK